MKIKNGQGLAPIHLAIKMNKEPLFNLLARFEPTLVIAVGTLYNFPTTATISMYEDSITLACITGSVPIVKRLIQSINLNIHTLNVKKGMLYACERNHIDVV